MKYYPLGDYVNLAEAKRLGIERQRPLGYDNGPGIKARAVRTGEKRRPLKGEWYLSGAEPAAYRAPNDLNSEYLIARLVAVELMTIISVREIA